MVVLILERVPASLRGELTRWLLELKAGVFVGDVSAMVRDKLWDMAWERARSGSGILLHSSDDEQGFKIKMFGSPGRTVVDFEGLSLLRVPRS